MTFKEIKKRCNKKYTKATYFSEPIEILNPEYILDGNDGYCYFNKKNIFFILSNVMTGCGIPDEDKHGFIRSYVISDCDSPVYKHIMNNIKLCKLSVNKNIKIL